MRLRRRDREVVCQQLVELVTCYVEGDLDPAVRDAVERHLAVCGHCTGYLDQVRRVLDLTAGVAPQPVPAGLLDDLIRRYREGRQ